MEAVAIGLAVAGLFVLWRIAQSLEAIRQSVTMVTMERYRIVEIGEGSKQRVVYNCRRLGSESDFTRLDQTQNEMSKLSQQHQDKVFVMEKRDPQTGEWIECY